MSQLFSTIMANRGTDIGGLAMLLIRAAVIGSLIWMGTCNNTNGNTPQYIQLDNYTKSYQDNQKKPHQPYNPASYQ